MVSAGLNRLELGGKKRRANRFLYWLSDEVVYAFTKTLRRAMRPTIPRRSNPTASKTPLPTLNERRYDTPINVRSPLQINSNFEKNILREEKITA